MTNSALIFSGPTLTLKMISSAFPGKWQDNSLILQNGSVLTVLPPVAEGDILKAMEQAPRIIGIIDGYFENIPSVWHKEILFAMSKGIHVCGSSSMGALRAAELAAFGMEGFGRIYDRFAAEIYEDDDEVTVVHGPAELGYPALSEAMVNIRATLDAASSAGIITLCQRQQLTDIAKSTYYKQRSYDGLFKKAAETGIQAQMIEQLKSWVKAHAVNQKKEDALAMTGAIIEKLREPTPPKKVFYHFENTLIWQQSRSYKPGQAIFENQEPLQ